MRLKSHSRDSYLTLYLSRLGDVTITRLPLETLGRLYCKASSKTLRGGEKTRCSVQLYGMSTARASLTVSNCYCVKTRPLRIKMLVTRRDDE